MNTTLKFAASFSRDIGLRDSIVSTDTPSDPYRETRVPLRITLPEGVHVGESEAWGPQVYRTGSPDAVFYPLGLRRSTRKRRGWFYGPGGGIYHVVLMDSQHGTELLAERA